MSDNDSQFSATVIITSTMADRVNTNTAIRRYTAIGFSIAFPHAKVVEAPLELCSNKIAEMKPELVVAIGSVVPDDTDLGTLRSACDRASSVLAVWLHDDPYEFDYSYKIREIADLVFTNDKWSLEYYDREHVYHLPMAGCPLTHYRQLDVINRRRSMLFFCGVAYPNRIEFFRMIKHVPGSIVVRGDHWPPDLPFARNVRMDASSFADSAMQSMLTLNIGRDFNVANRRLSLPPSTPGPRTFEIALAGSAQIYFADSLEIVDYFEPNSEILLVDSVRDVEEAIERAHDDSEWVLSIARRAQMRALHEHCYQHRALKIAQAFIEYKA